MIKVKNIKIIKGIKPKIRVGHIKILENGGKNKSKDDPPDKVRKSEKPEYWG